MDKLTADQLREARRPLVSLLSKSEKAQQNLASGSWQHRMLRDNIHALRIALALIDQNSPRTFTPTDMQAALQTLASLIGKARDAQARFAPGTSQHTLQRNRLRALQVAEALITANVAQQGDAANRHPH